MPDEFDTLGLQPAFDLARSEIDHAYLALAGQIHPDLAAGSEDAARQMAEINRAKSMLESAEFRADALLRRLGGPPADREKSLPPGFLAEMLSVREEIEAALMATDDVARRSQRAHWEQWSADQRRLATAEVGELFASLPVDPVARTEGLRRIRTRLNAWRYVERLIEQLEAEGRGA